MSIEHEGKDVAIGSSLYVVLVLQSHNTCKSPPGSALIDIP